MPGHFLVKSEPFKYSFAQLQKDGKTVWDGVRNFEARNNLRAMKRGDLLLFYHSNEGKEVVGVARVGKEAFADPTADPGEDWAAIEVEPVQPLQKPVGLAAIKAEPRLADIALVRKGRISVVPLTPAEFKLVLEMGETKLPKAPAKIPAKTKS